jgi:uncharacterized DUF497 family protein
VQEQQEIDYDPAENARNITERRLSFERVRDFDFGRAIISEDSRRAYPERRYVAVGPLDERIYVLCYTPIANGIGVLSFRKANKREVRRYETQTINR